MKFRNLLLFIIVFSAIQSSAHATNVSGNIATNTTWTTAGNPYIVVANTTVAAGVILTIQPGVEVKFNGNYYLNTLSTATLIAQGTVALPIKFTSNLASPTTGSWNYVSLSSTSAVTNCIVEYASQGFKVAATTPLQLHDNLIQNNSTGIDISTGANPNIYNTIFLGNTKGINISGTSASYPNPTINNNQFIEAANTTSHIYTSVSSGTVTATINATNNWWNTTDPTLILGKITDNFDNNILPLINFNPYLASAGGSVFPGSVAYGTISANTTWTSTNSPYVIAGNLTVNSGSTLTIQPGVQVKFNGNYTLTVNGTFDAQGTSGNTILITSNLANPVTGSWNQINLTSLSTNNIIKYATLQYANYAINAVGTSPTIQFNTIQNCARAIYLQNTSNALITDNTISLNNFGVYLTGGPGNYPNPTINNNSIFSNVNGTTSTNLYQNVPTGSVSNIVINALNNYWGSILPVTIEAGISSNSDNAIYAVVQFAPFLNAAGGTPTGHGVVLGNINANTTWNLAGSPYTVVGSMNVNSGYALTIDPGVTVKFNPTFYLSAASGGTINAVGTQAQPILFTSTNTVPAAGDWGYILPSSASTISYATIEYSNNGLYANATSPTLTNNTLRFNTNGIRIADAANPVVTGNTLTQNTRGINISGTASVYPNPTLTNNNFVSNTSYGFYTTASSGNASSVTLNAANNWWNSTTPSTIVTYIYDFTDNATSPVVNYSPFLNGPGGSAIGGQFINGTITSNQTWTSANSPYTITGNVTIPAGVTLTIQAGTVVKFDGNFNFTVDGTLDVQGAAGNLVTFTKNSANASVINWGNINLNTSSSSINYGLFEYGNYALTITSASPTIQNSTFQNNVRGLYFNGASTSTVTNNIIINNSTHGIYLNGSLANFPTPTITNNQIYGNLTKNLNLNSSDNANTIIINATNNYWGLTDANSILGTITHNNSNANYPVVNFTPFLNAANGTPMGQGFVLGNLNANTTWNLAGSPYTVVGNVNVNSGYILSIDPGVVIKVNPSLYVSAANGGAINSIGTIAQQVKFTSSNAIPAIADWNYLAPSSISTISNTIVEYANSGISANNTSPTLTNNISRYNTNGISITGAANPVVTGNTLTNNTRGINISGTSTVFPNPTLTNNNFVANTSYALYTTSSLGSAAAFTINATNNWWDTTTPSTIVNQIYDFTDNATSPVVTYAPFLNAPGGSSVGGQFLNGTITTNQTWTAANSPYTVTANVIIPTGVTITIDPGTIIQFDGNFNLTVDGTLLVQGVSGNAVTFTKNSNNPSVVNWGNIVLNNGSSLINYANVEFANYGFSINNASPLIQYSTVQNCSRGFNLIGTSNPSISNNVITNNVYGIFLNGSLASFPNPIIFNNQILSNTTRNLSTSSSDNANALTINATQNWWGSIDANAILATISHNNSTATSPVVQFTPFLDAPNGNSIGQGYVLGNLNTNTTWNLAGSPYIVAGNISINAGYTLTVDPGVIIKVNPGLYISAANGGTINSVGTQAQPITFTSSSSAPAIADWSSITLSSTSTISYTTVEYANNALYANSSSPTITNNTLRLNTNGIRVADNANPTVTGNTLSNNTRGINISGTSTIFPNPTITNNNFISNTSYALYATSSSGSASSFTINATNNWWNTITASSIVSQIYDFTDNANSPIVTYAPFLNGPNGQSIGGQFVNGTITSNQTWTTINSPYTVTANVIIPTGVTVTIQSGVIVEFDGNFNVTVDGTLHVQGAAGNPVVFTKNSSNASVTNWGNINFNNSSSSINYALLEYGNYAISLNNASPTITNSIFQNNVRGIYLNGTSSPFISANTITYNTYGFYINGSLSSYPNPTIANNHIENNTTKNIYANSSDNASTLTINAVNNWWGTADVSTILGTITHNSTNASFPVVQFTPFLNALNGSSMGQGFVAGNINTNTTWTLLGSPYTLFGTINVNSGYTLTIQPGVVVKIAVGGALSSLSGGTISAIGTGAQLITFTSNASSPAIADWTSLTLSSTSTISNSIVEYANNGIYANGSSPTITNNTCRFNTNGITVAGNASPTITANTLTQNTRGLNISGTSTTFPNPTISNNNFISNTSYALYTTSSSGSASGFTINATNNWWNTTTSSTIVASIYDFSDITTSPVVSFSPFLNGPGGTSIGGQFISGTITSNQTWTTANSPYTISANVTIPPGVTLTIQPGVVVKFDGNFSITVDGTLDVQGTFGNLVTFTKNVLNPAVTTWGQINLNSNSSIINYAQFEYGNYALTINNASPTIQNSIFQNNTRGIYLNTSSSSNINNNLIINNTHGIYIAGSSLSFPNPTLSNNQVFNNTNKNLTTTSPDLANAFTIDATNNWWGTMDPNSISSTITHNASNPNYPVVSFTPFLNAPNGSAIGQNFVLGNINRNTTWTPASSPYIVVGNISVTNGYSLTIQPGTIIKFNPGLQLSSTGGTLSAQGTAVSPITFTSNALNPAAQDWQYLNLSSTSILDNVIVEYSNLGVRLVGASPTISNSIIRNNNSGFHISDNSNAILTGNTITQNVHGIYLFENAAGTTFPTPILNNNNFSQNSYLNIETLVVLGNFSSITINANNNWWDSTSPLTIAGKINDNSDFPEKPYIDFTPYLDSLGGTPIGAGDIVGNINRNETWTQAENPYTLYTSATLGTGKQLTIQPGTTVKAYYYNTYLSDGQGSIQSQGNANNRITFSAAVSQPQPGHWGGIQLSNPSSSIAFSDISHATVGLSLTNFSSPIQNLKFDNNQTGLVTSNTSSIISSNVFSNNTSSGLNTVLSAVAIPTITNNQFTDNTKNLDASSPSGNFVVQAVNNWWGTTDSIEIANKIYDYSDTNNPNSGSVAFAPYLDGPNGTALPGTSIYGSLSSNQTWTTTGSPYFIIKTTTIPVGTALTINPGVSVKFNKFSFLEALGTLNAQGTSANNITFDGNFLTGYWSGIKLSSTSTVSYAQIEKGDQALWINNTSPSIHHNILRKNNSAIYILNGSSSSITNNIISQNQSGINIQITTAGSTVNPLVNNNQIYNNFTGYYIYSNNFTTSVSPGLNYSSTFINATNNWWGTTNTTTIATGIVDFTDNSTYPHVNYLPINNGSSVITFTPIIISPKIFSAGTPTTISYTLNKIADVSLKIYNKTNNALIRNLILNQPRSIGLNSEIWDGLDTAGQIAPVSNYYFILTATNSLNESGIYDPTFISGPVTIASGANTTPTSFDAYKGEAASVNYTLTSPAYVTVKIGTVGSTNILYRTLQNNVIRPSGANIDLWDGRNNSAQILSSNSYAVYIWANLVEENLIGVTNPLESTSPILSEPYGIYPAYGEISNINFNLPASGTVSVQILSPSSSFVIRNLMVNQPQSAGTVNIPWDGKNDLGQMVSAEGNYRIKLSLTSSGQTITKYGNISVFK